MTFAFKISALFVFEGTYRLYIWTDISHTSLKFWLTGFPRQAYSVSLEKSATTGLELIEIKSCLGQ